MAEEIDARGLVCPLPVLRLRKALAARAPGAEVTLLADDPMAAIDVPHFCAEQGHMLRAAEAPSPGLHRFTIRKGGT